MRFNIYCLLLMFGVFPKGLTALIQTHQTVMAAVGAEAHFNCRLTESKDVVQVTWQKVLPDYDKNVATYNKFFGQRVDPDFIGKVNFKDAGLQNCSIVIRKVTEQDEGCYLCLFNIYPDGALTGRTCLQLCELHEPILHVRESNSTEESVVSCSVTARPAPTVTLTVTQQHLYFSHYSTVTVNNNNGTVTVTTTAVLSGFHGDSPQVGCAVRVPSGPQKEVLMNIPEVKQTSADGSDEESGSENRDFRCTSVVLTVFGVCAVVIIVLCLQNHRQRDHKKIETPHSTPEDAHTSQTPSVIEGNDLTIPEGEPRTPSVRQDIELRKRTPPETNQESS